MMFRIKWLEWLTVICIIVALSTTSCLMQKWWWDYRMENW